MKPKVFISYSWTSPGHQALVKQWADLLLADGVDVVLDIYDLKEGHDKYAFMERMVTDVGVTHVLVVCDKIYSEKADARKAGVGTESQIISREVYEKVEQSKFIPIVCEVDEKGNPFLPAFLKSRIWIDFSTPEAVNENWEQLIRVLYGKPLHQKPKPGKTPAYVGDDSASPSSPAISKYNAFKQAILHGKAGLSLYRRDFLDACIDFADSLRVRDRPNVDSLGEKVLADCGLLKQVRNHIIDWVLLEATGAPSPEFSEALVGFLERMRELKSRPPELNSWNDAWFEAHSLFVYETFLYIVAALMKANDYEVLHEVFTSHYLLPETERYGEQQFDTFDSFCGYSETLQKVLATEGRRLYSPAAELIKRQADRKDLPFSSVIEAELVVLLMTLLTPNAQWSPGTLYYASYRRDFPFFLRATQHKGFKKLATITGINDADKLRAAVKEGHERLGTNSWHGFRRCGNIWESMNMDKLDTIK
ncbi:MAG: SEFIR domain-containing protein [Sedimentisphaerales bacterium]